MNASVDKKLGKLTYFTVWTILTIICLYFNEKPEIPFFQLSQSSVVRLNSPHGICDSFIASIFSLNDELKSLFAQCKLALANFFAFVDAGKEEVRPFSKTFLQNKWVKGWEQNAHI